MHYEKKCPHCIYLGDYDSRHINGIFSKVYDLYICDVDSCVHRSINEIKLINFHRKDNPGWETDYLVAQYTNCGQSFTGLLNDMTKLISEKMPFSELYDYVKPIYVAAMLYLNPVKF